MIKPTIIEIPYHNKIITVISDHKLLGGTKQRAMTKYLRSVLDKNELTTILFPAAANGLGMVAMANAYNELNGEYKIKLIIFTQKYESSSVVMARKLGAEVLVYDKPFRDIYKIQEEYAKKVQNPLMIELGGNDKRYINILAKEIKQVIDYLQIPNRENIHIWLVYGSGTLYSSFIKYLDKPVYHLVVVGKKPKFIREGDKVYYAKEGFYEDAKIKAPYPTENSYDGKIWEQLINEQYNYKPDDKIYIWNVGQLPKYKFAEYRNFIF